MTEPIEVTGTPSPSPIEVSVSPATEVAVLTVEGDESVTVTVASTPAVTLAVIEPEPITVEVTGPIGPAGPPGTSGTGSGGSYRHTQAVPAATWVIDHPLGYRPAVAIEDSAGSVIEGDVTYPDDATVVVHFTVATGGHANLS